MQNKLLYFFVVMLLAFSVQACVGKASQSSTSQPVTEQKPQSVTVQVIQPNKEVRDVQTLLTVIRDEHLRENDPERVTKAIETLGELRAAEASEDLAHLLTFKGKFEGGKNQTSPGVLTHLTPPGGLYPATTALFQIGKPALPALVRVIEEHEKNSLASVNATDTIVLIFRDRPGGAIEYLKEAASKSTAPGGSQRLYEAAEQAMTHID
jgi:hypothetical protein